MIFDNSGEVKVQPQEIRGPGYHEALLRGQTPEFGLWLWRLQQKFKLQHLQQKFYSVFNKTACIASAREIRAAVRSILTQRNIINRLLKG